MQERGKQQRAVQETPEGIFLSNQYFLLNTDRRRVPLGSVTRAKNVAPQAIQLYEEGGERSREK